MYILDTSAIRSIPRAKLTQAATKFPIAVSTLSVLELASHLNDSSSDSNFSLARGNLLKCQIAQMLDDPFYLLSQRIQSTANPTRREDKAVLSQLITAAEQSQTLAELDAKILSYPDGATASCRDIGKSIEEMLKQEEDSFVSHIRSLLVKLDPSLNGKHCLDAAEFLGQLTVAARSLSATDYPNLEARVFCETALYFGYLIYRTYQYANRTRPGEKVRSVDPNDCEDAYISLHLGLFRGDVLVTNDKGTLEALESTVELLNEACPALMIPKCVISNAEFVDAVET